MSTNHLLLIPWPNIMSSPPIIIHSTPPLTPLPASDPKSLYFIAACQLSCPDRWGVTKGDWAVNGGRLPYITHLEHVIPRHHLRSIPPYIDPNESLSREDRAEAIMWEGYIEGKVSDLVNHTMYSLPPNYSATIGQSHLSNLTFPRSQYIPQRLRGIHKARLQHVGLWGLGGMNEGDLAEEDRKRLEEGYVTGPGGTMAPKAWSGWGRGRDFDERRRKRGEDELVRMATEVFERLERRLAQRSYFFGERPTAPDLLLFAHLALVLAPSYPNPLLADTVHHFPALTSHYKRVLHTLFGSDAWSRLPFVKDPTPSAPTTSWMDYLRPSVWWTQDGPNGNTKRSSSSEKAFQRARWMWYAGAVGAMMTYLFASGLVSIQYGDAGDQVIEEDENDAEDEDEDQDDEAEKGASAVHADETLSAAIPPAVA